MGKDTPALLGKFIATMPLVRGSTRLDIADVTMWLASDKLDTGTGAGIEVDGGRCI